MFNKLRNKFIITNVVITGIVLTVAFVAIYFVAAVSADKRPPVHQEDVNIVYTNDIIEIVRERVRAERDSSLTSLMTSLLITGLAVELIVCFVSFFLAEQAIKPVKDAYNAQKNFIANASHEIKTPLAVIQANLEAADIKGNHWIDNIEKKTADLTVLNNQLLALARIESGQQKTEKPVEVVLPDLVHELTDFFLPQIQKKRLTHKIKTDHLKTTKYKIRQADFTQIFNILLDNAIKYGATKLTITISDHQVAITNDGATLKPGQIEHIFDRFYQTDKTKSGVGLGLAIAKTVADRNHWHLSASSTAKTTTFTLSLK